MSCPTLFRAVFGPNQSWWWLGFVDGSTSTIMVVEVGGFDDRYGREREMLGREKRKRKRMKRKKKKKEKRLMGFYGFQI